MPEVYRCTVCNDLSFGPVRFDNLFGLCRTCRRHRTFAVATDPEARRWAGMRARQRNQPDVLPGSGATASAAASVAGPVPALGPPPESGPADPFYPMGTDW